MNITGEGLNHLRLSNNPNITFQMNNNYIKEKIDAFVEDMRKHSYSRDENFGIILLVANNGTVSGSVVGQEKDIIMAMSGFLFDETGLSIVERANKVCMKVKERQSSNTQIEEED